MRPPFASALARLLQRHRVALVTLLLVAAMLVLLSAARAAISYVASQSAGSSVFDASSLTLNRPAGTTTGDVLVVAVANRFNHTLSAPSGWTQRLQTNGAQAPGIQIFTKTATASEPGSYTFSLPSPTTTVLAGTISSFGGVDGSDPILAIAAQANGSSGSATAPSITPGVSGAMLVTVFGTTGIAISTPSGMTTAASAEGSTGTYAVDVLTTYQQLTGSGATGTRVAALSGSDASNGISIALRPAVNYTISGTVFEDANYGGGAGRSMAAASGVGRSGVTVELYNASGSYLSSTTTGAGGTYSFNVSSAATFLVRVVNSTVTSSRTGSVSTLRAVQTYRTNASSGTATAVTDHVGGINPDQVDPGSASSGAALNPATGVFSAGLSGTAQSFAAVNASSSSVSGVDFGFNFNTVVNDNATGQGSLYQVITNANTLGSDASLAQAGRTAGIEHVVFMISNGTTGSGGSLSLSGGLRSSLNYFTTVAGSAMVTTIAQTTGLPFVTSTLVLDAQTQPGWTGVPLIELNGAGSGVHGLMLNADGSTARGFIVNRFTGEGITSFSGAGLVIQGNYIGLNAAGTAASGNNNSGIWINSTAGGHVIGGTASTQRNVIGGQTVYRGIAIAGGSGTVIKNNYIGTDVTGTLAIGNANDGIKLYSSVSNTTVGGINANEGNLIRSNGMRGVAVDCCGTGNAVRGNSIFGNGGGNASYIGIDLDTNGPTANNGTKGSGANSGMDFPIFTSASIAGTTLTVTGYVGSAANQSLFANAAVDVFISDQVQPAGQGRTYLGTLTADASGNFSGTLSGVTGVTSGSSKLTATATDGSGNTSEFGTNFTVTQSLAGTVFEDVNYGGGAGRNLATALASGGAVRPGVRVELYTVSGSTATMVTAATTNSLGNYVFNGLANGNYALRVVSSTVTSSRSGALPSLIPVTTYRAAGSTGTAVDVTNEVGGSGPSVTGNYNQSASAGNTSSTPVNYAEAFSLVTLNGPGISGIDFGYNFNTVTNLNDSGQGSLRQALINANTLTGDSSLAVQYRTAGIEHIVFMISNGTTGSGGILGLSGGLRSTVNFFSGGVATITPASALPALSTSMVLDGQTQPGWTANPIIELNGTSTSAGTDGLALSGASIRLRGLIINRFKRHGLYIAGAGATVQGCWIGLNNAGTAAAANGLNGIHVLTTGNTIGNAAVGLGNVISGNGANGVQLDAGPNTVQGNYIGTNAAGSAAIGNVSHGVYIGGGSGHIIGGSGSLQGNVISGNAGGIFVNAGGSNTIQGNYIGTSASGASALGNTGYFGIEIYGSGSNTVGGTAAGAGNLISGQSGAGKGGIYLASSSNSVRGNLIGVNAVASSGLPNAGPGIAIAVGSITGNTIGGATAGAANLIAFNGQQGVVVSGASSTGNTISRNAIHSNTGIGIDIAAAGRNANNGTKNATLGNQEMDTPVISSATSNGSSLAISGYVGSAAGQTTFAGATVELFKALADASGFGQGQTYIGSVTADASGNFSSTITVSGVNAGDLVTATATDASGNTSEFAANVTLAAPGITGTVYEDQNYGGGAGRSRAASGGVGVSGARVELYNASGTFVSATTTASDGSYTLNGISTNTAYFVRVVNSTVLSSRSGSVGSLVPVMTWRTEVPSGSTVAVTDEVGGMNPAKADAAAGAAGTSLWTLCAIENATCSFTGTRTVRYGANVSPTSGWTTRVLTGGTACTNAVFGDPLPGPAKSCYLLNADYQSVATVRVGTNGASGVDFGFSFDTVVNVNDSGQGSLRQAIVNANTLGGDASLAQAGRTAGIEHIVFMIPNGSTAGGDTATGGKLALSGGLRSSFNAFSGGAATLTLSSLLPLVSAPLVVDGQTQPGWTVTPVLVVDGNALSGVGISLGSGSSASVVSGLVVRRFTGVGLQVASGANGVTITGNHIGRLTAAGTDAGAGMGNTSHGMFVSGASAAIGGSSAALRNVIAGNGAIGIVANGNSAVIRGNHVGVDVSGATALANGSYGVDVRPGITSVAVGGTGAGDGNVVSGNGNAGVIYEVGSTGSIKGNRIGTNAAGTAAIGGVGAAVYIAAAGVVVGGTEANAGNTIAGSNTAGVIVNGSTTSGVLISSNNIFGNAGSGIDLGGDGITVNDGAKTASQPNLRMDSPVFTSAILNGTTLTVSGYVGSAAGQSTFGGARIEVFISDSARTHGSGKTYLGALTADASGNFSGSIADVTTAPTGTTQITATATDTANNTSEFGANATVANKVISGTVFEDLNYGGGAGRNKATALANGGSVRPGARVELAQVSGGTATVVAVSTTDASGNYSFTGLMPASYILRVLSSTVTSSRSGYVGGLMPVSTYHAYAPGGSAVDVTDEVGGRAPAFTTSSSIAANVGNSNPASVDYADGVASVTVSSGAVTGIDFGYSFNVVSNLNNSGQGSLRQAITNANTLGGDASLAQSGRTAGIEHLVFMISNGTSAAGLRSANNFFSGGVASIALAAQLPTVTSRLVLDAQTQPGWSLAPIVELNGAGAGIASGLVVDGPGSVVRGLVINRFAAEGIVSYSNGASALVIQGNWIGLNAAGTAASANANSAIWINQSAGGHLIGGTTAAQRNVLGGSTGFNGVALFGGSGNVVQGNYIGTNAAGTAIIANGSDGVKLFGGVSNSAVGGTTAGAGNLIRGNNGRGVVLLSGAIGNAILGNRIYGNTNIGIDLNADGASANDGAKSAGTANLTMDTPVFTAAALSGTDLTVTGYVGSAAGQSTFGGARVEVFIADNSSAAGQGQTYLGFVTADANGRFSGTINGVSGLTDGVTRITGTATDGSGNTSEFGANLLVGLTLSGTVFEDVNYGGGAGRNAATALANGGAGLAGVTVELFDGTGTWVRSTTTTAGGNYSFVGVGNGNHFVRVASSTVVSQRSGSTAGLRGVLTFRTTATSGSAVAVTDSVGGTNPAAADPGVATTGAVLNTSSYVFSAGLSGTAHAVAPVTISNAAITNLDFGFNFDTVVNVNDSDQGSLRQAITNANTLGGDASLAQAGRTAGIENLVFMIPNGTAAAGLRSALNLFSGGLATITPASALPSFSTPLVADAQTQPGWTSAPLVQIVGSSVPGQPGLYVTAAGVTLRGFLINRYANRGGIEFDVGSSAGVVQGCWIGLNAAGTAASANMTGIVLRSSGHLIGGTTASQRNVISGNTVHGIDLAGAGATSNSVQGNYMGTDASGAAAVGNGGHGVSVEPGATGNSIGGTAAGSGNVLSGNGGAGLQIDADNTLVQGNRVGLNAAGAAALPNGQSGITVWASNAFIGGTVAAARNVISGGYGVGVYIAPEANTGTVVQGNYIGTDISGTSIVGNAGPGVEINAPSSGATIGGTTAAAANLIRGNGGPGVVVGAGSSGNAILRNSFHGNGGLGIDLNGNGPSANDGAKTAGAANLLMDSPVITAARAAGNRLVIAGYVGSAAGQAVFANSRVDLYISDNSNAAGQGRTWLGTLSADASGNFSGAVTLALASLPAGTRLTATATDGANNTSEFGTNFSGLIVDLVVNDNGDAADANIGDGSCLTAAGVCTLRAAMAERNAWGALGSTPNIVFAIPGCSGYGAAGCTIKPTTALPIISHSVVIDASTQSGFNATTYAPLIEIDGSLVPAATTGLVLAANDSTLRGLAINRFPAHGVTLSGNNNSLLGNRIGLAVNAASKAPNVGAGAYITGTGARIGSTLAADRNVIAGNTGPGVQLTVGSATITSNFIGTDNAGSVNLGNGGAGVLVASGLSAVVIDSNVISGNGQAGVAVAAGSTSQVQIQFNSMAGNAGLGIDLGNDGVTANTGASDPSKPNLGINHPVITGAGLNATTMTVYGYIGTGSGQAAFAGARVDFYKAAVDPSGYGEGQTHIGFLTADANGRFSGSVSLGSSGAAVGDVITATATDANARTSEFGPNWTSTPIAALTPGSFNAFDSDAPAGALTYVIRSKVAGTPASFAVIALDNTGSALHPGFTGTVSLSWVDARDDSGAASGSCRASWPGLGSAGSAVFSNTARVTVNLTPPPSATRVMRLKMSYTDGSTTATACSNDAYAALPASLSWTNASDTDSATAGTSRVLDNTSVNGGVVHRAGRPFTVRARALDATGALMTGYDGSPVLSAAGCLLPSGCSAATLTAASTAAVAGQYTHNAVSYAEVGAIQLRLTDSNYADVDSADTAIGVRTLTSALLDVGRFIPDSLSLVVSSNGQLATGNGSCMASGQGATFTGQGFGWSSAPQLTVTARNAAGATTTRWTGSLMKLGAGQSEVLSATGLGSATLSTSYGTMAVQDLGGGQALVTASGTDRFVVDLASGTVQDSVTPSFSWTATVTDASEAAVSGNPTLAASATPSSVGFNSGAVFHVGRLALSPGYGDVRTGPRLLVQLQRYTAAGWITMTDDRGCVTVQPVNVAVESPTGVFATLGSCAAPMQAAVTTRGGRAWIAMPPTPGGAPGRLTLRLAGDAASGNSCTPAGASAALVPLGLPWLLGGTTAAGPQAWATWGTPQRDALLRRETW